MIELVSGQRFAAGFAAIFLVCFAPTGGDGQEPLSIAYTQSEPIVQVLNQTNAPPTGEGAEKPLVSGFPIHPSLELQGGYDDNVGTRGNQQGSWFTNARVTLFYGLHTERTQLSLLSGAGITYFFERANGQTYDVNSYVAFALSHKASQRITLTANVYAAYQTEPDFSSDVGVNSRSGNYFHTMDTFSFSYNWSPRFATVTSYTLRRVQYEDSSIGIFEDRFEHTFGEELRFNLFRPTVLLGEYRFEITDYDSFPRDSTSHFVLAGVDHHFTSRLSVDVRGGAVFRSFMNDGDREDPYFEGSLTYTGAHHSSLSWRTRYSVEEPSVRNALTRTTFRTGLELTYGLSTHWSLTAAAYYHHDENQGLEVTGLSFPGFAEDAFDAAVDLKYVVNRYCSFHFGYEHSEVSSPQGLRDYSRNRYFAGVSFSY